MNAGAGPRWCWRSLDVVLQTDVARVNLRGNCELRYDPARILGQPVVEVIGQNSLKRELNREEQRSEGDYESDDDAGGQPPANAQRHDAYALRT